MKLGKNLYFCIWCEKSFEKVIFKKTESKKGSVSGQCICPYCKRTISQK